MYENKIFSSTYALRHTTLHPTTLRFSNDSTMRIPPSLPIIIFQTTMKIKEEKKVLNIFIPSKDPGRLESKYQTER